MTDVRRPPPARGPYYPFRAKTVRLFERPLASTLPVVLPRWRWGGLVVAAALVLLAAALWFG